MEEQKNKIESSSSRTRDKFFLFLFFFPKLFLMSIQKRKIISLGKYDLSLYLKAVIFSFKLQVDL